MTRLVQIHLLHTAIWWFFAGCIVAIAIVGGRDHYGWAAVLIGLTHRAALGELRHLPAAVAGSIQQDDRWNTVRRLGIVRLGSLVDLFRSSTGSRGLGAFGESV
jgi:hypothetical protein